MKYEKDIVEFFQDYCAHHETMYNYSPLTAKIYTFLMLSESREGVTFDEIVEKLNASKSSVSSSLNLLVNNTHIEHFNKIDERKRYFRINPEYLTIRLNTIKEILDKEKSLTYRLKDYKAHKEAPSQDCQKRMGIYLEHLEQATRGLTHTIDKLKTSN
ncbi:GbsR/MarR family transcriptional regulator [Flavobacterium sp. JP2137]|uniref:GbsR/MarR family transcriptional regulator n=1 Tax=Flavobacterium sp. JP2137 TaxID=3414510 RepID=UPI003D2FE46B